MKTILLLLLVISNGLYASEAITATIKLGELLFFDTRLSKNNNLSCATCHNPSHGFIDNRAENTSSLGTDNKTFGSRNTPSIAYGKFSPPFHFDHKQKQWLGGQFLDGRATDLSSQATMPILNSKEMAMANQAAVVARIKAQPPYQTLFEAIGGLGVLENNTKTFEILAESIAVFEESKLFSPFDSKYDRYLKDEYQLSPLEDLGRALFFSSNNTNCTTCHQLKASADSVGETFSNYQYHNIGVPKNSKLKDMNQKDLGLLANPMVSEMSALGKFKVPSLRNIAITAPYMHNGVFENLETVMLFYDKFINENNTHNPETNQPWQTGEVTETINSAELSKGKKLTEKKVNALVAFLKTLTDKRYEHLLDQQ